MKGLLPNQVITVLDEETIVWGISCYKKTGELVDIAELEKMWESSRTKKSISQKLRRICAPHTGALFMGKCKRLTPVHPGYRLSRKERRDYKKDHPGYRLAFPARFPNFSIYISLMAIIISIVQLLK